ncbi:MAG: hypothetical protein J7623_22710 [Chitinophaga sp.]|uniref:hypothetical protein n=1 Tax=Chitinophaga sp. TaxID=1869181 RepID=UPI001B06A145|nr:hypothetical protein [Chitinophaga sp.]MBO9731470.1 hypothetical protein [Chitinophaga sp.]
MENTTITVRDLLYKILDYGHLWNKPDRIDSKPAQARHEQILVLADAFGLSKKSVNPLKMVQLIVARKKNEISRINYLKKYTDFEYLSLGEFIHDKSKESYKELRDKAFAFTLGRHPDIPEEHLKYFDVSGLFQDMFRYRQEIYNATEYPSAMLEGYSVALSYGWSLQHKLNSVIKDNISEIDDILCTILDPENRFFDKELIKYPDMDIDSIDREWEIDNF